MRPLSQGTCRWAFAGLLSIGVADLLAVNLVVGPAWIESSAAPPPLSQEAARPQPPAPESRRETAPEAARSAVPAAAGSAPVAASAPLATSGPTAAPASASATTPIAAAAPQPPAPPASAAAGSSGLGRLAFGSNSAVLTLEARELLVQVGKELRVRHKLRVRLEGHSDGAGSRELNQWLSVERARAARSYLSSLGVDVSRVEAAGFGADRPLDTSCHEPSCPVNRRVEILFVETP